MNRIMPPGTLRLSGMGSSKMREAGVEILIDSTELGVVGLFEVLKNIFLFINIFRFLVKKAENESPDAIILIDYPGFNIRFARQMRKRDIPIIWYISPQVWAWRKSNIPKLAEYCDRMMVIFPFEPDVYKDTALDVRFVGHPLVEHVTERLNPELKRDNNLILLLPGSRGHEVKRLLKPMLETAVELHRSSKKLKFEISTPREKIFALSKDILEKFKVENKNRPLPEIKLSTGKTAELMQTATAGLAASGTVTVECAVSGLPLTVVYKLNPFTFALARRVITLFRGFFTMVNIIADKEVYEEFLQKDVVPEKLAPAMNRILPGGERRAEVIKDIALVSSALCAGSGGKASFNAASCCVDFIKARERKIQG
jgi:lipid-A-disaccharide synthase